MPKGFRTRLIFGFVLVVALLGGTGIACVWQLVASDAKREAVVRQYLGEVATAERLRSAEEGQAAASRGYLLTRDPEFLQSLASERLAFDESRRDLEARATSTAAHDLLQSVNGAAAGYRRIQDRIMRQADQVDTTTIQRQFEWQVVPKRRELVEALDAFVTDVDSRLASGKEEARVLSRHALNTGVIGIVAAMLLSGLLAWSTSRHLTDAYLREARAVRSAKRSLTARNDLLGIVAHDLRSPLNAITMRAGVLTLTRDPERVSSQAASIVDIARRMDRLIKSLLDAASIESGRFSVQRAPCNATDILQDAMDLVEGTATEKGIRLLTDVREAELRVLGDREKTAQVLTNLVGNALKFTFEGGTVEICVEQLDAEVRFAVSDKGPGISPEHLPHVFDRFWKMESGGTRGAGLGLYIAKGIVEAQGGLIWVESTLGQGATFFFTIPRDKPVPRSSELEDAFHRASSTTADSVRSARSPAAGAR